MNNKLQLLLLTIATISSAQIFGAHQAHFLTTPQRRIASWDRTTAVDRFLQEYQYGENAFIYVDKANIFYGDNRQEYDREREGFKFTHTLENSVQRGFQRLWEIVDAEKAQREQTESLMKLAAAREDQSASILRQLREIQAQQATQFAEISAKVEALGTRLSTVESGLATTQAAVTALNSRIVAPTGAPTTQPTSSWAMEQPD